VGLVWPLTSPRATPTAGTERCSRSWAEAGALDGLGDIDLVVQRGHGGRAGLIGKEDGGEVESLTPAQEKGPSRVLPLEIFLAGGSPFRPA
jgi:hypothetical protein